MKETERLADGQIVSYKGRWLVALIVAGNTLLLTFEQYMEIYNIKLDPVEYLHNDALLSAVVGVNGRFAESLMGYLGGFADMADIIVTNQFVCEVSSND